jgi:ribokinase
VRFGCALASLSVTRPGTAPSMPTLAEIEAVLLGEPVKSGSVSAHQS